MRSVPMLIATALIVTSASAFGATNASQDKPAAASKTDAQGSSDRKYCIQHDSDEATGSRIYSRECRTKAEWASRGVDIDQLSQPE